MGKAMMLTVVRQATIDDLGRAGLAPDGDTCRGDEAAAEYDATRVVPLGDDLLVIGGVDAEHRDLPATLARALDTEVVSAQLVSTVGYYAWVVHHAGGLRRWEWAEGEPIFDKGDPLPEERGVFSLDKRTLLGLLEARTGVGHDWGERTAQNLRWQEPARKRRLFFRRRS